MVKSENQQWQDIIAIINYALSQKSINWKVRQLNQPTNIDLSTGCVYVSQVNSTRLGWQAHREKYINNEMVHSEQYIEQVMYQISGFKKRNPADINEMTSSDVLNYLITFFMSSEGNKYIRSLGYESFRISQLRNPVIVTDSDKYEKNPSFDITLVLLQTEDSSIDYTNTFNFDVKGV